MTMLVDVGSVGSYFESIADPRHTRNRNVNAGRKAGLPQVS
jgi:hypothetical protein